MMKGVLLSILLLFAIQAKGEGWRVGDVVTRSQIESYGIDRLFVAEPISDEIFERMAGKSYKAECTIPRNELCYIRALHITNEGIIKVGEMVVNRAISDDILYILRRLFDAGYAIERMELVDNYNADDEASMAANNSSAFNFRTTPGGTRLSAHSRGMAVDINPLYNPYVKVNGGKVIVAPKSADGYIDRNKTFPYKICKGDLCCRLFAERGFEWGGDYRTIKDYQHFEK
jgi:hypothetical protein